MSLQVHGFMMFFAWGLLFPGGAMVARYLKHINKDGWIRWVIRLPACDSLQITSKICRRVLFLQYSLFIHDQFFLIIFNPTVAFAVFISMRRRQEFALRYLDYCLQQRSSKGTLAFFFDFIAVIFYIGALLTG